MNPKNSPFKFLDSYTKDDLSVFFGREKETEDLYEALNGVKHLLVHGPSGSGKTSLIECGLRNQFSDADWYAVSIRKGSDINVSFFSSFNEALEKKIDLDPVTKLPLDSKLEFSGAIEKLFGERYQPVYLLFDQFEELLISGSAEEKTHFFSQLNKLIRRKLPCRILLIIREEFLGNLSEFEDLCPSIFQNRFRVEKMGRGVVIQVLNQILESKLYNEYFDVEDSMKLAESILRELPDKRKEIELTHVQVFLNELWDRGNKLISDQKKPVLNADLVKNEDNLETILTSFLEKQLTELALIFGKNLSLEVLVSMITKQFTKLQMSLQEVEMDLKKKEVNYDVSVNSVLSAIKQRRIIRSLVLDDIEKFEISHDALAIVIGQKQTDEMKMRERAEDTYKIMGAKGGLFSQEDLDYLRPYEQYLQYPSELKSRIEKSTIAITERINDELDKSRKRLRALTSLLAGTSLALISAGYLYNELGIEKHKTDLALKASLEIQSLKGKIEFNSLQSRAKVILDANGCPTLITKSMDSIAHTNPDSSKMESIIEAINEESQKKGNCK